MTQAELVQAYKASRQAVLDQFDATEGDLDKQYGPGKWTVRQILVHLADVELVCLWRYCRAAAEPGAPVEAFDENKWASHLNYEGRSLAVARAMFEANRDQLIEWLETVPAETLENTFHHSEAGPLKLGPFLANMIRHAYHHVDQIKAAREGREWKPEGAWGHAQK